MPETTCHTTVPRLLFGVVLLRGLESGSPSSCKMVSWGSGSASSSPFGSGLGEGSGLLIQIQPCLKLTS
jgi:hypothetical protein